MCALSVQSVSEMNQSKTQTSAQLTHQYQGSRKYAKHPRCANFSHYCKDERYRKGAEESRQSSKTAVGDTRSYIIVPNILKIKRSVEAIQPTTESQQELGQRWMHIEEVFSSDVV